MHIISTFYISKYASQLDTARSAELESCLLKNLSSPHVEKLHLFVDDNDALTRLNELSNHSDKIAVIDVGKKPTYSDFFRYILENMPDKICMITNADIYLHEVDDALITRLSTQKLMYALTRYEYDMSSPLIDPYHGSHDAYIFNSAFIDGGIINEHTEFYQNVLGIESRVVKTFCDIGFRVLNPCRQIKIVHLHKTELRNYANEWCGLHNWGDFEFQCRSCWWVPPVIIGEDDA